MHLPIPSSLHGKTIWLTGASAGIGEALAIELSRRGAILALTARRMTLLATLEKRIVGEGGKVRVFPGDVTDRDAMEEVVRKIQDGIGPIDILVANAGTHLFTRPSEFNSQEYLDLMDLNFGGVLRCIHAVMPSMQARRRGYIVGVASLAGYRALPRAAAYGASKAALIHFLESIRFHLVRDGIDVTVVNPGFVRTPLTEKNDFAMPFLLEAREAARLICDGMERRKKEIAFPAFFSGLLKIMRILPFPIYERIAHGVWRRQGFK
jgi:short-subunit dehydrogenase